MEIFKSNKGGEKLRFSGYLYVLHTERREFIRWRCSMSSSFKCRGSLTTDLNKTVPNVTSQHNHPADEEYVKVAKTVCEMKQRAKESGSKPVQIFAEAVQTLENTTRARMPLEDSMKRTLRNQKSKNLPSMPATLQELVIEGDWTMSGGLNPKRFLLHDNGPNAEERMIIFATDSSLRFLSQSNEWYFDGNFSLAPPMFLQLYVIRIRLRGLLLTAAFSLLQKKSQTMYENMLRTLLQKCEERQLYHDPTIIHVDFEKAVIQSITAVFGEEVNVKGCFYHLAQSTYRKVQELGLVVMYREDKNFSKFCGMLDGLVFLPLEDVHRGINFLRKIVLAAAEDLITYFDGTYVSGTYRRIGNEQNGPLRMRNIAPMFPPPLWNVHDSTLEDGDRTNNQTEGWNNRFSNLVEENHPSVWKIIEKICLEVAADSTKVEQRNLGVQQKKKKRNVFELMQTRLKNLCQQYVDGEKNIEEFLSAISHNIRFRTQE
ncbi:hypothetical protein RN001_006404 [Aquatica leii]|uniref:MULE transposase domain-containing protein n=1 Tax=Aquatica leii TaxID=1421715 RepID=A0AAN7Q8T6_9COLE|nr:hypothetical protein RN001_006404 [Aquatica leii]